MLHPFINGRVEANSLELSGISPGLVLRRSSVVYSFTSAHFRLPSLLPAPHNGDPPLTVPHPPILIFNHGQVATINRFWNQVSGRSVFVFRRCVGRWGCLQVTCRCGVGAADLSGPARRRSASTVTYRIPAEQAAKRYPRLARSDNCPSRAGRGFFVSLMQTNERCRSATTIKMSSFFSSFPFFFFFYFNILSCHKQMASRGGWRERSGRRIKEQGRHQATLAHH